MLAVLSAVAMVLSARLILLLSGIGGFILAFYAVQSPDGFKIAVNLVYDLAIFCPTCWLYITRG